MHNFPFRIVALWAKSIASIPPGWHICDGTSGTPDLRDKFLVGAGSTYNPGNTGGTTTHPHTATGDGHIHGLSAGTDIIQGPNEEPELGTESTTFTSNVSSSLPPYLSLVYIMEIGS